MIEAIRGWGRRAERVPLGVDLEKWPVQAPRRREHGAEARLVHVASLNHVKDQTTLLLAARSLGNRELDFHLDIIGPDTLDGAAAAMVRQLELDDRVTFHGYLPQDRVHSLVGNAHILLVSSRHEAGPLVALEAAVAGIPTVGTAVGHIAEWAPEAAVAVPVRNPDALAHETSRLLGDEERRLAIAHEAQRRALACDADATAVQFERIYREMINGTPTP
jgi:glycosyltransferase involved in cell wall biosynthesis